MRLEKTNNFRMFNILDNQYNLIQNKVKYYVHELVQEFYKEVFEIEDGNFVLKIHLWGAIHLRVEDLEDMIVNYFFLGRNEQYMTDYILDYLKKSRALMITYIDSDSVIKDKSLTLWPFEVEVERHYKNMHE